MMFLNWLDLYQLLVLTNNTDEPLFKDTLFNEKSIKEVSVIILFKIITKLFYINDLKA